MNEPNPLRPERSLDLTRPAALARVAPALVLLVLSPIVAEFLLGDFSVRQIGLLFAFIPQYGGGALLVRESARRAGKGWPSIILLALAYALIEEGFTTQSLFNPNYAGERLLDYGFIPAFGTSLNWAVFVLTIHVVWSIGSCIVIAEALAAERWSTPLGPRHALALATGAILTYGWLSIARMIVGRTTLGAPTTALDVVGQVALLLLVLLVIRSGARRIARASPDRPRIANAKMTMGRC